MPDKKDLNEIEVLGNFPSQTEVKNDGVGVGNEAEASFRERPVSKIETSGSSSSDRRTATAENDKEPINAPDSTIIGDGSQKKTDNPSDVEQLINVLIRKDQGSLLGQNGSSSEAFKAANILFGEETKDE